MGSVELRDWHFRLVPGGQEQQLYQIRHRKCSAMADRYKSHKCLKPICGSHLMLPHMQGTRNQTHHVPCRPWERTGHQGWLFLDPRRWGRTCDPPVSWLSINVTAISGHQPTRPANAGRRDQRRQVGLRRELGTSLLTSQLSVLCQPVVLAVGNRVLENALHGEVERSATSTGLVQVVAKGLRGEADAEDRNGWKGKARGTS